MDIQTTALGLIVHLALQLALLVRVILRPHREPASRVAWIVVIVALPIFGMLIYLLVGEVNIGRRRVERMRRVLAAMPAVADQRSPADNEPSLLPDRHRHLFDVSRSISRFPPTGGNRGALLADSDAAIDSVVADIDSAVDHVHVLFYIWLADTNGCKVVEALKRAASRGVQCRAMADGLGSRAMIRSTHWSAMREAGVHVGVALPIGNPLLRPLRGRIDLRNHRKIVVIDDAITYCGSQNCADAAFRVKAKYAPWVDAMIRFEGPIARQNQHVFASDWMTYVDEDLNDLLRRPMPRPDGPVVASVVATGPTVRYSSMPEMFESLIFSARRELTISTPYYVPNESLQDALCAAAFRGVETTMLFPARNDSWIVAAASRSYYRDLLDAGVNLWEYRGGLLHTKSLTMDGEISLIGSANMDRRSFELNYENNILFYDRQLTADLRRRQQEYLEHSIRVRRDDVANWTLQRRLWNNSIAMLGPVL